MYISTGSTRTKTMIVQILLLLQSYICNSQKLRLCNAGEYVNGNTCQNCTVGKYMDLLKHSRFSCKECQSGKVQSNEGKYTCHQCLPGTVPGAQRAKCQRCQSGTFQNEPGRSVCKDCPVGTHGIASICSDDTKTSEDECIYQSSGYVWGDDSTCRKYYCNNASFTTKFDCENIATGRTWDDSIKVCSETTFKVKNDCLYTNSGREWNNQTFDDRQTEDDCIYNKTINIWTNNNRCTDNTTDNRMDCLYKRNTNTWTLDRTQCRDCPRGFYQSKTRRTYCISCPAGFQQNNPVQTFCTECNPGRFQNMEMATNCKNCPINSYQDRQGGIECTACALGQYTAFEVSTSCFDCPDTGDCCSGWGLDNTNTCQPCEAGAVRNVTTNKCQQCPPQSISIKNTSLEGYDTCESCGNFTANKDNCLSDESDCPSGTFASDGYCQPCHQGTYRITSQSTTQSTTCTTCPTGWYNNDSGETSCVPCQAGTTNNTAHTSCTNCTSGKKSRTGGMCETTCTGNSVNSSTENKCSTCGDGQYYDNSNCTDCPIGWIKSQTMIASNGACVECPTGKVNNINRTQCQQCETGKQLNSTNCEDCQPGKFNPTVGGICRVCSSGQYQDNTGQSACDNCEAGQYRDEEGQINCTTCAAGKYAGQGQRACTDCPIGWGNADGSTCTEQIECITNYSCQHCADGKQMSDTKPYQCHDCPRGLYRDSGVGYRGKCAFCPTGYLQSEPGKSTCIQCNQDTEYSMASDQPNEGFVACVSQEICKVGQALQGGTTCTNCTDGTYSIGSGAACKECPRGYISTTGKGKCTRCRSGQEPDSAGTNCQNCTKGQVSQFGICAACPVGQTTNDSIVCSPCLKFKTTENGACTPCADRFDILKDGRCAYCPAGRYNPNTVIGAESACIECDNGEELTMSGSTKQCTECQAGKYIDGTENYCQTCPVGYTSGTGATECEQCSVSCLGMCPRGHYLVASECKKCPQGYASPGIRQTFCSQCTAGREQPISGESVCHDCAPGKYSTKSVNIHCELCPTGQYQHLVKQGQCNDCRPGKYTNSLGQITCKTCALGKYSDDTGAANDACKDCPKGWQGISDGTCAKCPESTYQDEQGQTVCKKCTGTEPLSRPAATNATDCFEGSGLKSYVFDVETDGKKSAVYTSRCEIRPNMVLLCPGCSCNDNSRDGYWDGPVCDECRHGFAGGRVGKCLIKCPGYDGVHDSTMCGGNGKCWFGKYGNGECLCGGKNVLDASSNNIVVNVKTCPAGHRCSGYGDEVLESTKYIPFYYILEYRQYSVFVLQLNLYTPTRGHMWFERYSPQTIYENVCATCTGSYDGTEYTQIGHFSEKSSEYTLFRPGIQVQNGFHGENCQHECAICLNSGHCLHVPHPFYYSYSIANTHETFSEVFVPQTQCICSSDIYDADAMCCPHGFEPYVYFGKRQVDPYFHHTALPFITNMVNARKTYWTDEDLWLKNEYPPYKAPISNTITVSNLNSAYDENTNRLGNEKVDYLTYGPYTKHVFYGTEKEICRACPGLFGKGVVSRSVEITSEDVAEDFWWDSAAKGKKCNGLGVCDFYLQRFESDNVLFMGDVKKVENTKYKLEKRFTGCAEQGTLLGTYTGIVKCIANRTLEAGTIKISEPYKISGYIGQQSIVGVPSSGTPTDDNGQAPWGYVVKDTQMYEMNQTSGFTSVPVPDANGEYLFHPWKEGECRHVVGVCKPTKDKLYSIYKIGITGQGEDRLVGATFDRFDTCFTYDDGTFKTKIGNYVTETYENGQDPFLGKNCPKGHFCTKTGHDFDNSVGFKEACPAGYYQPNEAETRTDTDIMCSRLQVSGITKEYQQITEGRCEDIVSARGWTDIETKIGCGIATNQTVSNVTATNVPSGCYYGSDMVYFNNHVSSIKCSVTHKCTCVRHGACQLHKGTQDPNDLVDSVCIRCKRNEYSKEGSAKCTACPQGRVKKISSIFGDEQIDSLTMLNMPSNLDSSFTPWYFIPKETGVEMSDCALVPNGIIHVPKADKHMNYKVPAFLPVVSCPFGYSSRPGTYVIWGHDKIVDRLQTSAANGTSFIHAPFIQDQSTFDTNSDGTTHLPLALDYCFRCPTNAMTSAGSMTCATCFANTLKFYLKDAIGQMVESTNLGKVADWIGVNGTHVSPPTTQYNIATPFQLSASPVTELTSNNWITLKNNITTTIPSLGTAYIVCNTYFDDWQEVGFNIAQGKVGCGVHSPSSTSTSVPGGFEVYKKEDVEPEPSWSTSAFPLCAACSPGQLTGSNNGGCVDCGTGKYTATMSDASLGQCKKCPIGYHQPSTGMTLCFSCGPGQFQNQETQSTCIDCPKGYSQSFSSASNCTGCLPGETQAVAGTAACNHCRSGRYEQASLAINTVCTACPKGWAQSKDHQAGCNECTPGQYQDVKGESSCKQCTPGFSAGTETEKGRVSLCPECPAGYSTNGHGQKKCEICTTGKYQDTGGQTACKNCQPGASCSHKASIPCAAGKFSADYTCKPCPDGEYSGKQSHICDECPLGWMSESTSGSKKCKNCGGVDWAEAFPAFVNKGSSHKKAFYANTKYVWNEYCTRNIAECDNQMICFARWDIFFYYTPEQTARSQSSDHEICFKKKGTVKTVLAFYLFGGLHPWTLPDIPGYGMMADLYKYWNEDSPSSSTMCQNTDAKWYKSDPFKFKSEDVTYRTQDWPETRDRRFYQNYDEVYDHAGKIVDDGTICHTIEFNGGNKYSLVMVYYGGSKLNWENKANVEITGNFKISKGGWVDPRCTKDGVFRR